MKTTVEISIERYEELIKKETIFDIKKAEVQKNNYATENERMLFLTEIKVERKNDDFF